LRTTALRTLTLGLALAALSSGCSGLQHTETAELWSEGDAHFDAGRYDEAIPYYDELLRRDDAESRAYVMRGASYERQGDSPSALSDYGQASYHGDVRGLLYSANLHIRANNFSAAEEELRRLRDMGLDGRDLVVHLTLLGTLRLQQGQLRLAVQNLERAIETGASYYDPTTAARLRDAHHNAAQACYLLGDFGRAYDHLESAVQNGGSGEDYYMLVLLAYLVGDFDASTMHLSRADPALVAEGAQILNDPTFGAGMGMEATR
jgi:tetratricopeptide (TPR) repeat protein